MSSCFDDNLRIVDDVFETLALDLSGKPGVELAVV